jgi:hypothetical protein
VLEHLALARGELVELRVACLRRLLPSGERVEHEAGETRREDRVALLHAPDRVGELLTGDPLRHVAACPGADDGDHVLGRVGHAQGKEAGPRARLARPAQHRNAAAVGHVHVEQHHVRLRATDRVDRLLDAARLPRDLQVLLELGPDAGPEQLVIVDDEYARGGHFSIRSSISVPWPGALRISARPP